MCKWVLVFEPYLEMAGSLVGSHLVGYPAADKPCLALVIKIDILDSFKIVCACLLQRHVVRRSLLSLVAHRALCLGDELLLGLTHIVNLLLVAEVNV
jgi:hypothetical protein